jgi:hypothetical protein
MSPARRARPVMKMVYFSETEWRDIQDIMSAIGVENFSGFARKMILNGRVLVNSRPMDAQRVRAMLAPIGNNINQIARHVNVEQVLYLEDLQAVRGLMEHAVRVIERYAKVVDLGDSEDRADTGNAE